MCIVLTVIAAALLFVTAELVYILCNGTPVPVPAIPRGPQTFGAGPGLIYVVMGDSTAVSQGSDYQDGYAIASARHLAQKHSVTLVNVGISGARAATVVRDQLAKAQDYKPDVVLLAVGANDATHFTRGSVVQRSLQQVVDGLRQANPRVHIVLTGSPAMDAVSRFPFGARQLMRLRTSQVNRAIASIVARNHLTFAPIARETRAAFLADPTLTAADNFHPSARGYALWVPVVNAALDAALR